MRATLTILGWAGVGAAAGGVLGRAAPAGFALGAVAGLLLGLFDWELARRRRRANISPVSEPVGATRPAQPDEFDLPPASPAP